MAIVIMLSGCASSSVVKGTVIGIRGSEITVRQEDDSVVGVNIKNPADIRILDKVVINKDAEAKVKDRIMGDF